VLALAAGPAIADIVRLADGTTLEGAAREDGDEIVLEAAGSGAVRLPRALVASIERTPAAATPAAGPPPGRATVAARPPGDAPKPTGEQIRRWIVESASADPAAAVAAADRLSRIPHADRFYRYANALWNPDPRVRIAATAYLRARNHPAALAPLLGRVLLESDDAARRAMGEALGVLPDPDRDVPRRLINAVTLGNDRATRARAAEVMGWTGQRRYIEILVTEYMTIWGRSNRAHIFVGEQRPYIQDFDVQVAAGAFALDPKIGYVQHGVVLDTTVLKIEEKWTEIEKKVYHDALVNLAGEDAGLNPADWKRWMGREAARKRDGAASRESSEPRKRSEP
jgi:hypothetical protein